MSESRSNIELQSSWSPSSGPAIETIERQSANQPRGTGINMKDVGKANIDAQVRGSLIGLTIGVSTAALGKRYWRLSANRAFLTAFRPFVVTLIRTRHLGSTYLWTVTALIPIFGCSPATLHLGFMLGWGIYLAVLVTGMTAAYGSTRWLLSQYLAELRLRKSLNAPMTSPSTSSDFQKRAP